MCLHCQWLICHSHYWWAGRLLGVHIPSEMRASIWCSARAWYTLCLLSLIHRERERGWSKAWVDWALIFNDDCASTLRLSFPTPIFERGVRTADIQLKCARLTHTRSFIQMFIYVLSTFNASFPETQSVLHFVVYFKIAQTPDFKNKIIFFFA